MGVKLTIFSYWMLDYLLIPLLDNISMVTMNCLDELIKEYAPEKLGILNEVILKGNLTERRCEMAEGHNIRVKYLAETLGDSKATILARETLYQVGLKLGREARERLGVTDNIDDLIKAATILYKVLGIKFHINKDEDILIIYKCSLTNYYTSLTCKILSAVDEGVVHGLNTKMTMKFKERITEDAENCIACLQHH